MASAAEQLASSFNFGTFAKATELRKRIWFTLTALIVYRVGTYIPVPGVDASVMAELMHRNGGGFLGMFDMFSGGALGRMTVFALNIMPYISASIITQLMTTAIPSLETLKKEGETGRKKLNQYTRYLTVLIALFQSYGIAVGLESMHGNTGPAVIDPGLFFRASCVITLVGGTMFLMWVGEQITARGIGNGTSLIIFAGIVANLPSALGRLLELGRTGGLSPVFIVAVLVLGAALIAFIVFMERAQRRVVIQYPKRQVGSRMFGGDSTHMPLKINTAGVIPPIFASSILLVPVTIAGFSANMTAPAWVPHWLAEGASSFASQLAQGAPLYLVTYAAMIVFFSYFYTAIVFNPEETADNLKKYGGFIPGIRPGANTASYFDHILIRLTTIGALYLVAVCLLPQILISKYGLPFALGGTSLMIVVSVTMDTITQMQSHLIAHQYEGLIRKNRVKGRGR
jgi:preprotein translocase subunit SecY